LCHRNNQEANMTLLIIGITGGVGHATAQAALAAGIRVRALHRSPETRPAPLASEPAIEWIRGDAMNADDARRAAEGCSAILHAANPPGYRNWRKLVVPMARNAAKAALAVNARLLVPGNIYNFGPDAFPIIREGAAQNPVSRKGRVRVEMEQMLRNSGARVAILRAGDFFGGHAPASWFQSVMVKPGRPLQSVTWPGPAGVGHTFAYLPDLAQTFVQLIQAEGRMQAFEDLHFAGHHMWDGREFAYRTARAANQIPEKVKRFPWALAMLAWPFVPLVREIAEMRYLWQQDAALDNARLCALIGREPHTPLDQALHRSLAELGCLNGDLEPGKSDPIVSQSPA